MSSNEKNVTNPEKDLKKIVASVIKKYEANEMLRTKYSEEPPKFLDSEMELYAAIDNLQNSATETNIYDVLLETNVPAILLNSVQHPNVDISLKAITTIQDLTDYESSLDVDDFFWSLKDNNAIEVLVENCKRLRETVPAECEGIENSLCIMEHLVEFDHDFARDSIHIMLDWVITYLKGKRKYEKLMLPKVALVSTLMSMGEEYVEAFHDCGGVGIFLQQVAYYRRTPPATPTEHEYLEQVTNTICRSMIANTTNRDDFYLEEGAELVELILAERRTSTRRSNIKFCAIKILDHAITASGVHDAVSCKICEKFIAGTGLRNLFPILLKPKLLLHDNLKRTDYQRHLDDIEEHTCSVVMHLMKFCQNTELTQRMLTKLCEGDFEKLTRLISMHEEIYHIVHDDPEANDIIDGQLGKMRHNKYFTLVSVNQSILMACYLSNQFDPFDPVSGRTLLNRVSEILALERPDMKMQILDTAQDHLETLSGEQSQALIEMMRYFREEIPLRRVLNMPNGGDHLRNVLQHH